MKNLLIAIVIIWNLAFVGIYWDAMPWNNWTASKIYKEYNSAVCLAYVKWGYKVYLDGEDYTDSVCRLFGGDTDKPVEFLHNFTEFDEGVGKWNTDYGCNSSSATAFFIRKDGILATNLHVIKPWLPDYNSESESYRMEQRMREDIRERFGKKDTAFYYLADNLKVRGAVDSVWIVPNFAKNNAENGIPCKVIAESNYLTEDDYGSKDLKNFQTFWDMDVALIQTESETLPSFVHQVIGNWAEAYSTVGGGAIRVLSNYWRTPIFHRLSVRTKFKYFCDY